MFKGTLKEENDIFYVKLEGRYALFIKKMLSDLKEEDCIIDLKGPKTDEFPLSYVYVLGFTDEDLEDYFKNMGIKFKNSKTTIKIKYLKLFLEKLFYRSGMLDALIICKNILIRIDHDEYIVILPKLEKREEVKRTLYKLLPKI